MARHSSARTRELTSHVSEETSHVFETPRTNTIINALKRRAQAVVNDRSIDA